MADESDRSEAQQGQATTWWENKLTLLVVGFILTGLIGPWLQFVQKTLEWKPEISLQSYNRRLTAMQSARRELTKTYVAATLIMENFERERKRGRPPATGPGISVITGVI